MRAISGVLRWLGVFTLLFGVLGTVWAVMLLIQAETGLRISSLEPYRGDYAKAALASVLASMFFVIAGAGLVLLSQPLRRRDKSALERGPWWMTLLAVVLGVYGIASFALATLLAGRADELEGAAPGIVSYCMVAGVGSIIAAWGLRRATREH